MSAHLVTIDMLARGPVADRRSAFACPLLAASLLPMHTQSMTVSGPMTIYEVSDWRETFLHSLKPGVALDVDLHTSGPWDAAGLQLLVSLVNTGYQRDCEVRFQLVPKVCREIARRAGLGQWLTERSSSEL